MDYLLKASGIVIILFIFYYIFLKNETFFKSIRSFFIAGLLIVLALPLIEIPISIETVSTNLNSLNYEEIVSNNNMEQSIDWTQILIIIYLIGVAFFSVKFLVQLISLGNLISKHQLIKRENYYFVETSKNISPFSFFKIIIYNKSQFKADELEHIINHEKAHVKQWHSIDSILAHLLVITLWFNPFVWLYKKAVQQNLEFLADAYALELANSHKLYQFTLLKTCSTNYCTAITNNFYNSLIKKRIIMLHKNRSKNKSQWKYALLLPLLVAFIFAFNTKVIAQEKKLTEIEEISNVKIELVIDKNSTDEVLNNEKETFKKEFEITLSFKGIKRNASNEITAIKIEAKGENTQAKFENSGNKPIKPIKISYDSDNNSISINNLSKIHKSHYTYEIKKDGDVEFEGKSDEDDNFVFVASDGKTKTWTSNGDSSKNIELKVISEKNARKNVWIHKTDNDKVNKHKISKKENFVFISSGDEEPLYILDGKEISSEEMKNIEPDTIEKMEVLKGKSATDKYGDKAKGGVIILTMKK